MAKCDKPEITDYRYYYEAWLGRANLEKTVPPNDCLNIYKINNATKHYFSPSEANIYKVNLMEKFFSKDKEFKIVRTPFMIHTQLTIDSFFKYFKKLVGKNK